MDLEKQYFPLAFEEIRKLMAHGATTHRDDQEWREHNELVHISHLDDHLNAYHNDPSPTPEDNDSNQPQLTHVATRALMALEVYLGGGVVK